MALVKEIASSYGISASYHRILAISLNCRKRRAVICVGSYIDKEKRKEGYDPIDTIDIRVGEDDYPLFLSGNALEAAYKWLRENVEGMEDASDD